MTFQMRAAQQSLLAQSAAADLLAASLVAKGFVAARGKALGQLLVDDKRGRRSQIFIDGHGQLTQIVSPLGRSHRLFYDEQQRITGLVDANGLATSLSFTPAGLLAALTRGEEQRWTFEWDDDSNLIRVTLPDGTPLYSHASRRKTTC